MYCLWLDDRSLNSFETLQYVSSTCKCAPVRHSLLCNTLEFPLSNWCFWEWLICIKRLKTIMANYTKCFYSLKRFWWFSINRDNILKGLYNMYWFRWYFGDIHVSDILVCKLFSFRLSQLRIDRMARVKQIRSNFHDIAYDDDDDGFFPFCRSWWPWWWGGLFVVKVMSRRQNNLWTIKYDCQVCIPSFIFV